MANWIQSAVKHPGAMTAAASKAGESNSQYEEQHKGDSGTAGKRARLALVLKGLQKAGGRKKAKSDNDGDE